MTDADVIKLIHAYLEVCHMRVTTTKHSDYAGEYTTVAVTIYSPNGSIILSDSDDIYV